MTPAPAPLPFFGNWKITQTGNSRPDLPHIFSATGSLWAKDDGLDYLFEGTWSDGRKIKTTALIQMDGNWYPLAGSEIADSINFLLLNDGSLEVKMRMSGHPTGIVYATAAPGGRTLTSNWELPGPDGSSIRWSFRHERLD